MLMMRYTVEIVLGKRGKRKPSALFVLLFVIIRGFGRHLGQCGGGMGRRGGSGVVSSISKKAVDCVSLKLQHLEGQSHHT